MLFSNNNIVYRILIVCLICCPLLSSGADRPGGLDRHHEYFVSPHGSDTSNGSEAHPWATLNRASRNLRPGDVVHVAPGVYHGNVTTLANGTDDARIRYVSDVQWAAKLVGDGSTSAVWINGTNTHPPSAGNYVDIVGFEITGDSTTRAGVINFGTAVHFLGNKVHDVGLASCGTANGVSGVTIGANYSASDEWADGNVIYDIPTDPSVSLPSSCHDVIGLYFANPGGHAYNNMVFNVVNWGFSTNHFADHLVVANNLFFHDGFLNNHCNGGGMVISASGTSIDHSTIINNIAYDNCGYGIRDYHSTGGNNLYIHNLLFKNVLGKNEVFFDCNPGCQRAAIGTVKADPAFVNYRADGTGDYHLRQGSPAIHGGTNTCSGSGGRDACAAPVDLDGGLRHPTVPDIGPYEYGAHPSEYLARYGFAGRGERRSTR